MFEVTGVDRIDSAEDHGMNFLKAEKRGACRMPLVMMVSPIFMSAVDLIFAMK